MVSGITYNFFPFMALPIYVSLEQIDPRLLEAAKDLYASPDAGVPARHAPALGTGDRGGDAPHLHPGGGRLHQRGAARHAEAGDDRERHPGEVPDSLDYPTAAASSFILMAMILVALLVYARVVGSERLTG